MGPLNERVRQWVKRVPGVLWLYVTIQSQYFFLREWLGCPARKDSLVSRAYWDRRAQRRWSVDQAPHDVYAQALGELIEMLNSFSWGTLLEVGCGGGRVLFALRSAFPGRVLLGADFSRSQLERTGSSATGCFSLIQADARQIPLKDKSVDVILTSAALIYLHPDEVPGVLVEFHRVTRSFVLLAEYARDHLDTPKRKGLMMRAPFYGHRFEPLLLSAGFSLRQSGLLKAWKDRPDWTPESFFLAQSHRSNSGAS